MKKGEDGGQREWREYESKGINAYLGVQKRCVGRLKRKIHPERGSSS